MGDWLFGCDVCQEVCPHNEKVPLTTWPEFRPESGIGKSLSLLNVLSIRSDEEFKQRFKGTALLRARRCGLLRSAVIVAANKAFEEAVPMLHQLAQSDPDAIVRGHTVWALLRFPSHASEQVVRSAATEENALVRQEALWVQQKWDEGESGRELLDV
jgi:epoxyqueuosine reductase